MIPNYTIQFPTIEELKEKYSSYKPTITNNSQTSILIRNLAWTGPISSRKKNDSVINYGVTLNLEKIKEKERKEGTKITEYWGIIDTLMNKDKELAMLYWNYIIDYTNNLNEYKPKI